VVLTNGSGTFSFDGVTSTADIVSQILANPQNFLLQRAHHAERRRRDSRVS